MPDPEAVAEVAVEWLRRAEVDLLTARMLSARRESLEPWVVAFHAQQAAEKSIKAALVIEQVRIPRTHELERLAALLQTDWGLPDDTRLAEMSRFAVVGRYPEGMSDVGPEPDWADAEEAIALAESLYSTISAAVRERGAGHRG